MTGNNFSLVKKITPHLGLITILFFATLVRCYDITLPYCKSWEIGFQEIVAKNHFSYGFDQTHFVSVISVFNGENIYHLAHQPLLQILISLSYHLFGVHEWSARLVVITFSLGSVILIYAIADRVWNRPAAFFTALFAAFMPMSAYFGRVVNFEPLVLFFVLFFAWAYLLWSETDNNGYFALAIVSVILGGLTDWPFFLILPIFLVLSLVTRKHLLKTGLLFFFGCGLAAGYLIIKNNFVGYQSGVAGWFSHILDRSSIPSYIFREELYSIIRTRLWNNFSISVILALVGLIILVYFFWNVRKTRESLKEKELIPLALLFFGLVYLGIFLESTYIHEWQMYYLIPGVSLYSGFALSILWIREGKTIESKKLARLFCLVIIILFLALSGIQLANLHSYQNNESYYFGSRINEWTVPTDPILVIRLILPIMYYADRPLLQSPLEYPDLSKIQDFKPKVVVFESGNVTEGSWNKENLTTLLTNNGYTRLTNRTIFDIWTRGIFVPEVFARDYSSIEVHNLRTGDLVPHADTKSSVSLSYVNGDQANLLEHPFRDAEIRVKYVLDVPKGSFLSFGIGLAETTWDPAKGDGVQFEVFCNAENNRSQIFSQYTDPKNNPEDRKWKYYSVPFGDCFGNATEISFVTLPGPRNDNTYDWAYWINPRIERA